MRSGRPPKPEGEKRNRNVPTHQWVVLPPEGRSGPVPRLPGHIAWAEDTKKWWRDIWRSPMATQWSDKDVHALIELALLRQKLVIDERVSVASEVRQRSDEFGLTVAGRRALRWVIGEAPEVEEQVPDEMAERRAERRKRLAGE